MVNDPSAIRKPASDGRANHAVGGVLRILSRDGERLERELAEDLAASWPQLERPESAEEWLTRPAVLRRVAARVAESIPPEVNRIVGTGPGATTLATAASLVTGLPFAVVQSPATGAPATADAGFGCLHQGENVALVSVSPLPADAVDAVLSPHAVRRSTWIVVAAPEAQSREAGPYRPLFTFDPGGAIRAEKETLS
jgi:hypothetical protein